ncbi:hypothetical protein [Aquihabitans sp. McL0605]|uniref:hypothetical protein n=1 Tax=Aquihabitans sp. McL0605 TaxID=3415671 RepID=UPI003CE82871
MHLATYDFDGDPYALQAGYERLVAAFDDEVILNLCVSRPDGITVYDACPTLADFEAFSTSDAFAQALAAAGLPEPRTTSLGTVTAVHGTMVSVSA